MTVVNIVVAVVLSLAVLLGVIWFAPLWIRVVYQNELRVYAGMGPVYKKLVPSNPKKEEKTDNKKKKKIKKFSDKTEDVCKQTQSPDSSEKTDTSENNKKMSVGEVLGTVKEILEQVLDLFHKKAKIRIDALNVVVSREEAADTAIQFGLCSGIVSAILALASAFGKSIIKDENVSIVPDFITGKSRIETDVTMSVRTCHVIVLAIKLLIKNYNKFNKT